MTNPVLRRALAYAARGWPVFPCQPGAKTPATPHGYRDATTDRAADHRTGSPVSPGRNLAIATGAPGPDVLDIDQHGDAGNGFGAAARLRDAGLLDGAAAWVRTPSGGLHLYFTGTAQRCGHLPGCHLDFLSAGGYVLAPPSAVGGHPYRGLATSGQAGPLDWAAVTALLHPQRQPACPSRGRASSRPRPGPPGPLGRRPARGQPQRRPVLGRQPRPRNGPGRGPEPAGRRRPPGRPARRRDHPHPRLRPPHQPAPSPPARPPSRGQLR